MAKIITTSRGKTFDVDLFFHYAREDSCSITLQDERRLPEIAQDFDGLDSITLNDPAGATQYTGYNRLTRVQIIRGGVQLRLEKGGE